MCFNITNSYFSVRLMDNENKKRTFLLDIAEEDYKTFLVYFGHKILKKISHKSACEFDLFLCIFGIISSKKTIYRWTKNSGKQIIHCKEEVRKLKHKKCNSNINIAMYAAIEYLQLHAVIVLSFSFTATLYLKGWRMWAHSILLPISSTLLSQLLLYWCGILIVYYIVFAIIVVLLSSFFILSTTVFHKILSPPILQRI